MSQCPYPEILTNQASGKTESNRLYIAWHEGFEAHKLELISKVKFLEMQINELTSEIIKIKGLKRDIEKQRAKFYDNN